MKKEENYKSRVFKIAVIGVGGAVWFAAFVAFALTATWQNELIVCALAPVTIAVGMFTTTFQLPSGLKFTEERITFTPSDAIVILIAYNYGVAPAVLIAGIESFASSRRNGRTSQFSTILFSSAMMALAAGAAGAFIAATPHFSFGLPGEQSLIVAAVVLIIASSVQTLVNIGLLSLMLSLRHGTSFLSYLKGFFAVAPSLLVTGTVAGVLHIALSFNAVLLVVIGVPLIAALLVAQRQQRDSVQKRMSILEKAHRETIEALAVTINAKDEVTHDHVLRVQIYSAGVARILGCDHTEVEALKAGALLHDIGKIAVPDYILNKPGKLTAQEFEKMKMHTVVGAQILGRVEFPYPVVPIVRSHHERWDGKGYPDGLKAEEIPLTARILSVVDCFDAVREDRQYRRAMTREEAIGLLMDGSGTQYDPRVVGAFVTHLPEFEAEINANRHTPVPSFGIEPKEELSEAARQVAPAAGLAETVEHTEEPQSSAPKLTHTELDALYALTRTLQFGEHTEAARSFTDALGKLVPFDLCTLTLTHPVTGENRVVHLASNMKAGVPPDVAELLERRAIGVGEGVTGWVMANRRFFSNVDPKLDLPTDAPTCLMEHFQNFRTIAAVPIFHERTVFGAVTLYSSAIGEYTPTHERLLTEATTLFAAALRTRQTIAVEASAKTAEAAPPPDALYTESTDAIESAMTH